MKILVVEDNPAQAYLIGCQLKIIGLDQVEILDSGNKAIRRLDRCSEPDMWIDLVLIDINLQDMSGLEVVKRYMYSSAPQPHYVMLSAAVDDEAINYYCAKLGVKLYEKPDLSQLRFILEQYR